MWNPKSGASAEQSRKDVSVSDGLLEKSLSGSASSDTSPYLQKGTASIEHDSQLCEIDSGFISGPQLSGYEDDEDSSKDSTGATHHTERPAFKKQTTVVEVKPSILDSGCIDDSTADLEEASSNMLFDKKVDSGLPERFCSLSLTNSNEPLNNLGASATVSLSDSSYGTMTKSIPQVNVNIPDDRKQQPWEIYYRQNDDGDTQLHIACITGHIEIVAALIHLAVHPCLLDIQNDEAQTALHLAIMTRRPDIARMLLVAGAQTTMRDHSGNSPLHLACIYGQMDCVQALTMPITATEIQENSKMLLLTNADKSTILRRCTQLPADLEQRNYDGERCVHLAAQNNHIEILRHLVWYGADINARDGRSGKTPLHIAIEQCNELLANFLLEECQKLNLETETYAGLTAYQLAVVNHYEQIANGLEQHGADPLKPPEDDEFDSDDDDSQLYNRYGDSSYFASFNGGKAINVA